MKGRSLWLIGQVAGVSVGIAMWMHHGGAIGLATGYIILLLVDIREQTTPNV